MNDVKQLSERSRWLSREMLAVSRKAEVTLLKRSAMLAQHGHTSASLIQMLLHQMPPQQRQQVQQNIAADVARLRDEITQMVVDTEEMHGTEHCGVFPLIMRVPKEMLPGAGEDRLGE